MRNVIILGAGGAAAEVTFYIEDHNSKVEDCDQFKILGYIDYTKDFWEKYKFKAPILCNIDSYIPGLDEEVLVAVGDMPSRKKMIKKLLQKKARIGSFIHDSVIRPKNLELGVGNIIFPFCILEDHAVIGSYNFLTSYSFISHDCVVGDNNFLSVAGLAGSVTIGNNNYFGIRSLVIPGKIIGNNNVIQAGMIVDKNVKDNTTVFYRYKEQVLAIPKQE
ncbi:acetyltransferase [Flavobacteriaceae bacterium F89]|uniref:Acetyltransferase n=1 Tax=Cerina litoralis TaxID=2874477 RepID=A0AAE3EVP9_9FLAO|nr:acetyltransferase [Cerina litoralis]MCG2461194.1 acetyltransferase [Cerina litoralis]